MNESYNSFVDEPITPFRDYLSYHKLLCKPRPVCIDPLDVPLKSRNHQNFTKMSSKYHRYDAKEINDHEISQGQHSSQLATQLAYELFYLRTIDLYPVGILVLQPASLLVLLMTFICHHSKLTFDQADTSLGVFVFTSCFS